MWRAAVPSDQEFRYTLYNPVYVSISYRPISEFMSYKLHLYYPFAPKYRCIIRIIYRDLRLLPIAVALHELLVALRDPAVVLHVGQDAAGARPRGVALGEAEARLAVQQLLRHSDEARLEEAQGQLALRIPKRRG